MENAAESVSEGVVQQASGVGQVMAVGKTAAGVEGDKGDSREAPSLAYTIAAVAGLPQEVLRRIVGYCTL